MTNNYAQALGIHNKWAPILFAVLYFFLMIWYIIQIFRRHRSVYSGLAFFSAVRVVAYSLRAAMANNSKDAVNKNMAIAYEVLYSVGFFSILLSAYNLMHSRDRLAKFQQTGKKASNMFHRSRIMHLLLFIAVVLGTVGIVYALGNFGHNGLGNGLNSASTYIFLVVMVIIAVLTVLLIMLERSLRTNNSPAIGANHHHLILIIIGVLLLLRTLFYAATVHNRLNGSTPAQGAQGNEKLWYPLVALTELLVALLFLTPGLVPLRSLLHGRGNGEHIDDVDNTGAYPEKNGKAHHYGAQQTGVPAADHTGPMAGNAYNNRDSMQTAV
ncbi:hypothetical protein FRB96_008763 [Tulasnella sp. 330]|nr:hypothetical protein FRB96_008763 [Tulasnella sp. 330]KAG8884118.1 hypothetical protein FRB97_005101 [Tulasnella sp. 331]KAG8890208.1 hypothetical protein FRB98_000536 [Tulasnella sp. 332]